VLTRQAEEYLEAIARLEEKGALVTTSALASEHGVSPPSVTEMVRRLSKQGLVSYEARGRVALTDRGRTMARSVVRRHRLWERFLHDVLRVEWDRVYEEACQLEHVTSPIVEEQLARAVGINTTCPHGHAIPTDTGPMISPATISLVDLPPSQPARVANVKGDDPALLRQLGRAGIRPGALIEVSSSSPGTGDILVKAGGNSYPLPLEVAREVRVVLVGPKELEPRTVSLAALVPGEAGMVEEVMPGKTS